jgi:hypothetical protein
MKMKVYLTKKCARSGIRTNFITDPDPGSGQISSRIQIPDQGGKIAPEPDPKYRYLIER